ncbi:alpha/beta hydrolase [Cellulomonas sp. WB94]|uniref:alpha/beta fold hydrolase n=1 Tax=Cellulomonas sp. WB94 TaxID=2173174 RepID=UPI000D585AC7|nr:alpha/beta hydrolase [Cellulomonas sp. WB94]PVU83665.1 alpha/beta hydrolase [Cellulomonas sp. WB94]
MTPTTRLDVLTYRTGPSDLLPLVLLHAFPLDSRMWDDMAPLVAGARTVLAVDLPGLGRSAGLGTSAPSLDDAADAVAQTLTAVGLERAIVVGLSMGGYVALALLDRHPALVAGLGLLDTRSTADDDAARANRLRVAAELESSGTVDAVRPMATALLGESSRTLHPELVDRVGALIGQQSAAGVAWSQRAMAARPDRTAVLHQFEGPALVLVGDEDVAAPVAAAEHMVAALAASQLVVVPHAGHLTAIEDPDAVADAISELAGRADVEDQRARS